MKYRFGPTWNWSIIIIHDGGNIGVVFLSSWHDQMILLWCHSWRSTGASHVGILNEGEAALSNSRFFTMAWFLNPELAIHPNLKPPSGKWPPELGNRSCKIDQKSWFRFNQDTKDLENVQLQCVRNHSLCSRIVTSKLYLVGLWESIRLAGKFPHKQLLLQMNDDIPYFKSH